jgi:hypothetical protein
VKLYILPDLLVTVGPDDRFLGKDASIVHYRRIHDDLLNNNALLQFSRNNKPLDQTDSKIIPWLATNGTLGSPVEYNSKAYEKRFGDNFDVLTITQHVIHEIAHWYPQLTEDDAWKVAYLTTNAYVKKCQALGNSPVISSGSQCQSFALFKKATLRNGVPDYHGFRTLEPVGKGDTCLDAYFQSWRKLSGERAAANETVDMVTRMLNGERKEFVNPSEAFLGALIAGAVVTSLTAGLPYYLAPFLGEAAAIAVDSYSSQNIAALNRQIENYNKSIDHAVWTANQYRPSKIDELLFLDRQFAYSILYDATVDSTQTLDAAIQNFDFTLPQVQLSGFKSSSVIKYLKKLAGSKKVCAPGLPSSADLGVFIGLGE